MKAEERLASYGTLAPGKENYHQLDGLNGRWIKGSVRGRSLKSTEGIWKGFPAFKLDPQGEMVDVDIFISADLPQHWQRLDDFEGEHYSRVVVKADTDEGELDVSIYEFNA